MYNTIVNIEITLSFKKTRRIIIEDKDIFKINDFVKFSQAVHDKLRIVMQIVDIIACLWYSLGSIRDISIKKG